jgi:hypothetical protein
MKAPVRATRGSNRTGRCTDNRATFSTSSFCGTTCDTREDRAADCTTAGPDGYLDLTAKFDAPSIANALGPVADGDVKMLKLTGTLKEEFGETSIGGEDVVVIIKK